jgi:hypothetical protein
MVIILVSFLLKVFTWSHLLRPGQVGPGSDISGSLRISQFGQNWRLGIELYV